MTTTDSELVAAVEAGWDKAISESWYLNATPSDSPEGIEVVKPEIIAGRAAFRALLDHHASEVAKLMEANAKLTAFVEKTIAIHDDPTLDREDTMDAISRLIGQARALLASLAESEEAT